MWIGTAGGGMVLLTADKKRRFSAVHGLAGNVVRDCAAVGDELWVATDRGLLRFEDAKERFALQQEGRFLRVVQSGDTAVAADARGRIVQIHAGDIREHRVEFTPIALAGDGNGFWAAGGMNGELYLSRSRTRHTLYAPVIAILAYKDRIYLATDGGLTILEQ